MRTFIDYSALMGHAFGRAAVERVRKMARDGASEAEIRRFIAEAVDAENEWRASQGIATVVISGVAA